MTSLLLLYITSVAFAPFNCFFLRASFSLPSSNSSSPPSGMTPLLAAAVTGHTHIVEYLVTRSDLVQPHQKIDALELLGATYVDKRRDLHKAKKLWLEALFER